jgi:hypothetical protein
MLRVLIPLEMHPFVPILDEAGNDTESLSALPAEKRRVDPCMGGTYTAVQV